MPTFSEDFIEEVKNSVDIVELISNYIPLKKTGKNYKGLCPFHQEKTPSFTVNPDKQFYYCFGCGAGGNVFNFLMEIENITFQESLKLLAQRAGLDLPVQKPYQHQIYAERDRIFSINQLAAKFYHYLLLKKEVGQKALDYLLQRGFSREDMEKYQLGYAPPGWQNLLHFMSSRGYRAEELLKAGLVLPGSNNSYYDRFRDRVIFPIFNSRGEVLGFGGRVTSTAQNTPKYLNSPDTLIYNKGENLYGLNWARQSIRRSGEAIIMEGYTDVLRAYQKGLDTAVASLGTALTHEQAKLLKRYAQTVYIAYDADTAGAKATVRGLDILKEEGLQVRVISLPEGLDPDEFLSQKGKEAFEELKRKALNLLDFKIEQAIAHKDLTQAVERVEASKEAVKVLAEVRDRIEQEVYLQKLAQHLQIEVEILREELKQYLRNQGKKKDKIYKKRYTKKDNETNSLNNINRLERLILKFLIDDPKLWDLVQDKLNPDSFSPASKAIAKELWLNRDLGIEEIIEKVADDKLRKDLLALAVAEKQPFSQEKFLILIQEFFYQQELNLLANMQRKRDLPLEELNNILIAFQRLSILRGKEGL